MNWRYILVLGIYFIGISLIILEGFPSPWERPIPFDIPEHSVMQMPQKNRLVDIFSLLIPHLIVIIFSHFVYLNRLKKKVELEKYKTELQNIQYQLQPHFLFNSLNNIYSISITKPENTPAYILELSNVLRYILNTSSKSAVTLAEEIKFCRDYIDLQRLRYGKRSELWDITIDDSDHCYGLQISPFLIIPLIENVFKYGMQKESGNPIKIGIRCTEKGLELRTQNNKNNIETFEDTLLESKKIGLSKTKKRLEMTYSGRYKLDINEDENTYSLFLAIDLI